jgi:hypothetical protein
MPTTDSLNPLALPLPITQVARNAARRFARQQPTPEKATQVWLNTLAVCAMHDYLHLMGISTDLSMSDSWNPVVQLCADVADLQITGVGRLECRVLGDRQSAYVPPDAWFDRIGYVVVQISDDADEAIVLGFAPTVVGEWLPLNQLQPVEDLLDHLDRLMHPVAVAGAAPVDRRRTDLSQWLVNIFETGWQTIESLLRPSDLELAYQFRGMPSAVLEPERAAVVRRAKLLQLVTPIDEHPVVLVVELTPGSEQKRDVLLQLHAMGTQVYLPPYLQLRVLDRSGSVFLEAQARRADNYLQLRFRGVPGEPFSIEVGLGDTRLVEDFVI